MRRDDAIPAGVVRPEVHLDIRAGFDALVAFELHVEAEIAGARGHDRQRCDREREDRDEVASAHGRPPGVRDAACPGNPGAASLGTWTGAAARGLKNDAKAHEAMPGLLRRYIPPPAAVTRDRPGN